MSSLVDKNSLALLVIIILSNQLYFYQLITFPLITVNVIDYLFHINYVTSLTFEPVFYLRYFRIHFRQHQFKQLLKILLCPLNYTSMMPPSGEAVELLLDFFGYLNLIIETSRKDDNRQMGSLLYCRSRLVFVVFLQ